MAAKKVVRTKRRERKNIEHGDAHIHSRDIGSAAESRVVPLQMHAGRVDDTGQIHDAAAADRPGQDEVG